MRAFSLLVAAAAFVGASAQGLRAAEKEERSLYVANYGGKAFNGRYPINACYNFQRYPTPTFSDCDGSKAAQAFCKKEGYARMLGYETSSFQELGVPAVFFMGTQNVAEAGILDPNTKVLTEVKCDQV